MRAVPEWVGASPDSTPPPRVRLRIFDRDGGVCHISGRKIRAGEAWQLDHKIALCNGGLNVESNLAPALTAPHKAKTAQDVAEKAIIYRKRAKHLGIAPKRAKIQSGPFRKSNPQRTASRPLNRGFQS